MAERLSSRITKAKDQPAKHLSLASSLVGVGIGAKPSGEYEIVVFVADEANPVLAKAPHSWQGFPVRTEVTGIPKKFGGRKRF